MKIACISDLHGHLPPIEPCDLLIVAGDVCPVYNHTLEFQSIWLQDNFVPWLDSIQTKKKVVVLGNHDLVAERQPKLLPYFSDNTSILTNESIEFDGLTIYGTPYSLEFFPEHWAFNITEEKWAKELDKVQKADIIISHGPPYGFGDKTQSGKNVGSRALLSAIKRLGPKLVVCGHIHEARGNYSFENSVILNTSYVNLAYKPVNKPYSFLANI